MPAQKFNTRAYISAIEEEFAKHANAERAAGAKAYMRDQFDYYGLSTPIRRAAEKAFHASHPSPPIGAMASIVHTLWKKPQRELQYFAMELCYQYRKSFPPEWMSLFEFMITHKSWWDTVDYIAPKLVASYFQLYPEMIGKKTTAWMKSENIWLMRTALVFQNLHKKKTDEKLLFALISDCMDQEDFFIRKAIGWSLRQYARTNPAAVKKFVKANEKLLSELSKKEALKHIS